jgi:hypothetical protein
LELSSNAHETKTRHHETETQKKRPAGQ